MSRPIYKDVTPEEMMRMRTEDLLTNQEIADRVGCNVATVRRYIGTMPREMRSRINHFGALARGSGTTFEQPPKPVENVTGAHKPPTIKELSLTLKGDLGVYQIDLALGTVEIDSDVMTGTLALNRVTEFCEELQAMLQTALAIGKGVA